MRRKDREVTDRARLKEIIGSCRCLRIGLIDDGQVYIVPVSFGCVEEEGNFTFYFHSAKEGKKIELIKKNPSAGFELDTDYELKTAGTACAHSAYFKSIAGQGEISIVENTEEKRLGLRAVMEQNTGSAEWEFPEKMLDAVCVLKLTVSRLTGKEHVSREQ